MSTPTGPPFFDPSFTPTFTPTFTPSPPSPTSGFSSIFQSPGGPPLILVCIAAGLLLGAFIGVLLMRRMRPPPIAQRGIGAAAFFAGANQPLGEKPKLVDIHLLPPPATGVDGTGSAGHGTGKEKLGEHGAWGTVSPFAAQYLHPAPSADRPRSLFPSAQSPFASRNRTPLARLAARMPWADPRWRAGAHELSPPAGAQPEARAVQLAVTVSMPSPRHPSFLPPLPKSGSSHGVHAPPAHKGHDDEDPMPDCCIGTVVVSYGQGHDLNAAAPSPAAAAPAVPPAVTS
ncbi:hypothetical protein GSI_14457 [Ganoderma sinense ZZ0214-1]|uniref:Uncharacterized protein n=1 Tax=Ganoderma sinense ZZ0214-1 TaxID=1077348 RepID=A0A2G8RP89_9APHY|nr:hypothetical protein GSI_14457 [Ganoderma sinense ZZ0214-1]